MSEPLRIAVLGCGQLAEYVADRVYPQVRDDVEVVAAIDIHPERAARIGARLGAPPFESLDAAHAAVAFDAVDVRLPHHLHLLGVEQATRLQKHVLVEKPMATTVTECLEHIRLARQAGIVLAVGESFGVMEAVVAAKSALADGMIGKLLALQTARVFQLGAEWQRDGWRVDDGSAAGVLLEYSCHMSRMLHAVVGPIEAVSAFVRSSDGANAGEDSAVVGLRFVNGAIGQQLYCWSSPTDGLSMPELSLYGTTGSLHVWVDYVGEEGGLLLRRRGQPDNWLTTRRNYYDSLAIVLREFAAACGGGGELIAGSVGEAVRDIAVLEAIRKAADTGGSIVVEEVHVPHAG